MKKVITDAVTGQTTVVDLTSAEAEAIQNRRLAALTPAHYAAAIQVHIDNTARGRGYADGVALASYATSTIPTWVAEAAAFVLWRDTVWLYAYTQLEAVSLGQRPQPTVAGFVEELPQIVWPA